MQDLLRTLLSGSPLDEPAARRAFELILTGQANESQVAAMLTLLAVRGPTLAEVIAGARVMREHVTRLPIDEADPIRASLIDTCGTGGAPKTFNISTAAAIVAASSAPAPGRPRAFVAKHGGRSRSGRGSAEVLAALGVNIDASPAVQARCLRECGVCFSFAVNHHPAMRFAAGPRKSLGFPTVFNLLGPLCNPAGATRQLVGVSDPAWVGLVSGALAALGATRAMVVHGSDGMDEITTTGQSSVAHVERGAVRHQTLDPRELGIERAAPESLVAGSLEDAAAAVRRAIAGEPGPGRDIVSLNAAAALVVSGAHDELPAALASAREAMERGDALRTLDLLARLSREPA